MGKKKSQLVPPFIVVGAAPAPAASAKSINNTASKKKEPRTTTATTVDAGARRAVSPRSASRAYHHLPVVLFGGVALSALLYQRFVSLPQGVAAGEPVDVADAQLRLGLLAAIVTMITIGGVYFPSTLLTRPHPAIWRMMLAMGIMYNLLLVFLLFQCDKMPAAIVRWYDPSVPDHLPERTYAEDCRVYTEDSWFHFGGSLDVFVAAHLFGYVFKTLILRDWRLVTCVSLGFEIVEITFQHILPNFKECWWDHLLLDVLLCNGGGTLIGVLLLKWARAKEYRFIQKDREDGVKPSVGVQSGKHRSRRGGIISKVVNQFFPEHVELYQWNVFQSPKRFMSVSILLALVLIHDMNTFTSKAMLQLEPEHHLVTVRMCLWACLAVPAVREYYEFINNPKATTLGTTACVTILGMTVECLLLGRMIHHGGYFMEPEMPLHVAIPWMLVLASFGLWVPLYFALVVPAKRRCVAAAAGRRDASGRSCVCFSYQVLSLLINSLFYVACAGLIGMFCMGMPDLQWGRTPFEAFVAPYATTILFWRQS
eukprot:gene9029-6331_t